MPVTLTACPSPAAYFRQLPPEKQTAQKMMTAMRMRMKMMMSFIFMFCHHMRLRSWRPVLWNLSACREGVEEGVEEGEGVWGGRGGEEGWW